MNKLKGFSLVELMVAMVIGLILMAGILQIFISNKRGLEITQDVGVLQENGRISTSLIAEALRMADHWGGGRW